METRALSLPFGRDLSTGIPTYDFLLRSFPGPWTLGGIKAYMEKREAEGAAASTLLTLRAAFKKAVRGQVTDTRILAAVEEAFKSIRPARPDRKVYAEEIPDADRVAALISAASPRMALLIRTLADTGLRISEALGIRLKDIEEREGFAFIRIMGKRKKERRIFIPSADLRRIREAFGSKTYLFESEKGGRLFRQNVWTYVHDLSVRTSGTGIRPHALRHYFATHTLAAGKDVHAVSKFMGHASAATTLDMYAHAELKPADLFKIA